MHSLFLFEAYYNDLTGVCRCMSSGKRDAQKQNQDITDKRDKDGAKVLVIDTNVLIRRPDVFLSSRDSQVGIPLWVF